MPAGYLEEDWLNTRRSLKRDYARIKYTVLFINTRVSFKDDTRAVKDRLPSIFRMALGIISVNNCLIVQSNPTVCNWFNVALTIC